MIGELPLFQNTEPRIPDDILAMQPTLRNFFENTTTVQFDHRVLAITTLVCINTLFLAARGVNLHRRARFAVTGLTHMSWFQVHAFKYQPLTSSGTFGNQHSHLFCSHASCGVTSRYLPWDEAAHSHASRVACSPHSRDMVLPRDQSCSKVNGNRIIIKLYFIQQRGVENGRMGENCSG